MLGLEEEVNRWVHAAEMRARGHKINKKKNGAETKYVGIKKTQRQNGRNFLFFFSVFLPNKLVTWYLVHYSSVNIESSKLDIKNDTTLFEIIKTVCVLII